MKINSKITELLVDLKETETTGTDYNLSAEQNDLRSNLLALYRETENEVSRDTIVSIMAEAGYPWFGKLARSNSKIEISEPANDVPFGEGQLMSDEDFLELLPLNGHFH